MEKSTEQIFDEILQEAKNGKVFLETTEKNSPWAFDVNFFASTDKDLPSETNLAPILKITNKNRLIKKIDEYLDEAKVFYEFEKKFFELTDESYKKKLIFDLFINASPFDFEFFIPYLETRKQMLNHHFSNRTRILGSYEDLKVLAKVEKKPSNIEAPFKMEIKLTDDNDEFVLPKITFGIDDKKVVHVYSIQNKKDIEKTPLFKKMDRHFRSVNKGIDPASTIAQISPSSLVAFTIFASYFESNNINEFVFHSYFPLRYQSHKNRSEHAFIDDDLASEEANKIEFNATNKLLYCAMRFSHHFPNSEYYYDDFSGTAHLKVDTLFPELEELGNKTAEEIEELQILEENIITSVPDIIYENKIKEILSEYVPEKQ